jgi:hypothetical protein
MVVPLQDKLDFISLSYNRSVHALQLFVDEMRKGMAGSRENLSAMAQNLRALVGEMENGTPVVLVESTTTPVDRGTSIDRGFLERTAEDLEHIKVRFPELLLEMAFIYRVALFDALLPDLLNAVLVSRPEMLRSDKKLSHEQILDCTDMPSLIALMVQKELQSVSYQSISDQQSWMRKHLGIELFDDQDECNQMIELTARRNLFVHANGFVNERYKTLIPTSSYIVGERLLVTEEYWAASDEILQTVSDHLLHEIHRKFCNTTGRTD